MKNRKFLSIISACLAVVLGVCAVPVLSSWSRLDASAKETQYIDNSDVMPLYVSDKYINLEEGGEEQPDSPSWLKTAVMVEVRLDTASTDGTLEGCIPMLEHYQEMGVNVLWVTPISEMGSWMPDPNGYNALGMHTIEPDLTGTTDYEEGWECFAWFVREAHKRNIRILLDTVPWGVTYAAPLVQEHPEYFLRDAQGNLVEDNWGGYKYDWESKEFREWFKQVHLDIVETCDLDGFRADVDPDYSGYDHWAELRQEALEMGHKIVVMSELTNERQQSYDIEQYGVLTYEDGWNYDKHFFASYARDYLLEKNIVQAVKDGTSIGSKLMQLASDSGRYRFYTYNFSNHDCGFTRFNNDLIRVGYQGIFSPFIPLWYMGEEMNYRVNNATLYYAVESLDYTLLNDAENRHFYETLKQYIRIRRTYPDIFENFQNSTRDDLICEVQVSGMEKYVAYARYDENGNAIIVIPNANVNGKNGKMSVMVPFEETGLDMYKKYTVTDLMTNKTIVTGDASKAGIFNVEIPNGELGIYLVKGADKKEIKTKTETVYNDIVQDEEGEVTVIENPIVGKQTITNTNYITKSGTLSWVFWASLAGSGLVCIAAVVWLTIYLIRRRKRRNAI